MDDLTARIEIWKKIVDVQQHFNDLELRIRNFALIVTGAFLGLGGYAIKDGGFTNIGGKDISSASIIIGVSLVPLCAFYLMDRLWYHRLLDGAVRAGIEAEEQLIVAQSTGKLNSDTVIRANLGAHIKQTSPFKLWIFGSTVHSRHKMDGFYSLLAVAIIALAITLAYATKSPRAHGEPRSNINIEAIITRSILVDREAAQRMCESYAESLLNQSMSVPGSLVTDPKTGNQAAFVHGHWQLVPRCR